MSVGSQASGPGCLAGKPVRHGAGLLLPGDESKLGLRFVPDPATKTRPNLAHLHLTSRTAADQEATVARALELGASHVDFGQTPEDGHIVLEDPDGNEFCVIEAGNRFLAGCGFLGELACDGPREVGVFWSQALGWPLVWDQDEETAVQSPAGGTKVSWGGEPPAPPTVRRRLRLFVVASGDLDGEIARLVSLGASRADPHSDGVQCLIDPGGNQFEIALG
ncbi:MAG: VOC family protein [Acidimicrobiales bacterium]